MNAGYLLSQTPLFQGLSPESRRVLAAVCQPREFRKRAVLFREGEAGAALYLLVIGRVRLHKARDGGRPVVIKVVKPGEAFAEVMLFERTRYPVTAVALTGGVFLRLLRQDVRRLLRNEDFRDDFIAMLIAKQRYLAERIGQLTSPDIELRFRTFLREQYGDARVIPIAISKKEVAAAIGTTPETFSRLIRRLTRRGALTWKNKVLTLHPKA